MRKRLLSILLAACVLLTLLPVNALAAETDADEANPLPSLEDSREADEWDAPEEDGLPEEPETSKLPEDAKESELPENPEDAKESELPEVPETSDALEEIPEEAAAPDSLDAEAADGGISLLADHPFAGGSGTEDDPYLVATAAQFLLIGSYTEGYFRQTANFAYPGFLSKLQEDCVYDGDHFSISGATEELVTGNYGTIKNVHIVDCNIIGDRSGYRSGLVYQNHGTIQNCSVSGDISGLTFAGGIVYRNHPDSVISGCVNFAAVKARQNNKNYGSNAYAGGIAGENNGLIENCYNLGHIGTLGNLNGEITNFCYAGFLAGRNNSGGRFKNCYCSPLARFYPSPKGIHDPLIAYSDKSGVMTNCYLPASSSYSGGQAMPISDEEFLGQKGADLLNSDVPGIWEDDIHNMAGGFPVLAWQNKLYPSVVANPESGSFDDPFEVELTSDRSTMYYTLDGSDPQGSNAIRYTRPFQIADGNTTLRAWAEGERRSITYQYHVTPYPVRASLEPGTYTETQLLRLEAVRDGDQTIYYTTNGMDPSLTTLRDTYGGYIVLDKTTTIKAAARQPDGSWGETSTYEYIIAPEIAASPAAGNYTMPLSVKLSCAMDGAELYYTTDGSDPAVSGTLYTEPIYIIKTTEIKAETKTGGVWSGDVKTFRYEIPEVSIDPRMLEDGSEFVRPAPSGDYNKPFLLIPGFESPGYTLTLYVSLDGGEFRRYTDYTTSGGLYIYKTTNVRAQLRGGTEVVSEITRDYTFPALEITPSLAAGSYQTVQDVSLSCNLSGYDIYYTLDYSDPAKNGTLYTGPFRMDRTASLKVCAMYRGQELPGSQRSFYYSFSGIAEVRSDQYAGTKQNPITVTLTCPAAGGYQIFYTLDGSDPAENGILYTAPIYLDHTVELRAIPILTISGRKILGAASSWKYVFAGLLDVKNLTITPRADGYALSGTLDNRYAEEKSAFFCAASYNAAGRLVETKFFPSASAASGTASLGGLFTHSRNLHHFKVMTLEKDTLAPIGGVLTSGVFDHLSVSQTSVSRDYSSYAYNQQPLLVTAYYTDGTIRDLNPNQYTVNSSNQTAVRFSNGNIVFETPGKAVLTVSYTEGGVTDTATVQAETTVRYYSNQPLVPDFGAVWNFSPIVSASSGYVYEFKNGMSTALERYINLLRTLDFELSYDSVFDTTFQNACVRIGLTLKDINAKDSGFFINIINEAGHETGQTYSRYPQVLNPQFYFQNLFMVKQGYSDSGTSYGYMYCLPASAVASTDALKRYVADFVQQGYSLDNYGMSGDSLITVLQKGSRRISIAYNNQDYILLVDIR